MDCIFCKIVDGKIPSKRVLEDETAIVISDLHPQAKQHFLVIPKNHTTSLAEVFQSPSAGQELISKLFSMVNRLVQQERLLPGGFRTVINTGENGGQTVPHLHIHVLGGGPLKGHFG